MSAALARKVRSLAEARQKKDFAAAARLAEDSVAGFRALAAEQPLLAARGLELVADVRRTAKGGQKLGAGDREDLALYREAARLFRQTPGARGYETPGACGYEAAVTALKAAAIARRLGQEKALLEALGWARECEEDFPARMAREALAELAAERGDFAAAVEALGDLDTYWPPYLDVPGALLFGAGRYREAAVIWERAEPPLDGLPRLCRAWCLFKAGDRRAAGQVLREALKHEHSFHGEARAEAQKLARFVAGKSRALPKGYDRAWGPIERPQGHPVDLDLFSSFKELRLRAVHAEVVRLAHGETLELAGLLLAEAEQRKSSGERHEREPHVAVLERALAILDREKGPNSPETTPVLRELFWNARAPAAAARHARRFLDNAAREGGHLDSAESLASRLALFLAPSDLAGAFAVAEGWLARCLAGGAKPSELAHTLAELERRRGGFAAQAERLSQALFLLDPEHYDFEDRSYTWKLERLEACRAAGAPDAALEKELNEARAGWAAQWLGGLRKAAKERAAVPLLQPYLRPGARFGGAPHEVMVKVGEKVGRRFLGMRINARPAQRAMLEATAPHAAVTTFGGYAADDISIYECETADAPEVREAFSTADDATPLAGGRMYFWWD